MTIIFIYKLKMPVKLNNITGPRSTHLVLLMGNAGSIT